MLVPAFLNRADVVVSLKQVRGERVCEVARFAIPALTANPRISYLANRILEISKVARSRNLLHSYHQSVSET